MSYISMRPPLLIYPVDDLDKCDTFLQREGRLGGSNLNFFADCILMRPASLVIDLYHALSHPPYNAIQGDYVRAEARDEKGTRKLVRKDEMLTYENRVIRIMTNKKVSWQIISKSNKPECS